MDIEYLTRLVVTPVPRNTPSNHLHKSTDKVMLVEPFVIKVTHKDIQHTITTPAGYLSDGASVPRVFHRIYHPFTTESRHAATTHDHIYSHLYTKYSKEFADALLKEMIKKDGGSKFMQWCFYRAVRLNITGGGWNK